MILCPNCHNQELPGALFCSECATRLIDSHAPTTNSIQRNQTGLLVSQSGPPSTPAPVNPVIPVEPAVSMHLVESGAMMQLNGQTEFTLGRIAEGQSILPDIDLSPYDGYTQGVSRLHAAIKTNNQRVFITDLGSSNGTRVNGQKIMPNVDYPLNHGDLIALGKFKIQILIRK